MADGKSGDEALEVSRGIPTGIFATCAMLTVIARLAVLVLLVGTLRKRGS
jgi:hypothetical protein